MSTCTRQRLISQYLTAAQGAVACIVELIQTQAVCSRARTENTYLIVIDVGDAGISCILTDARSAWLQAGGLVLQHAFTPPCMFRAEFGPNGSVESRGRKYSAGTTV